MHWAEGNCHLGHLLLLVPRNDHLATRGSRATQIRAVLVKWWERGKIQIAIGSRRRRKIRHRNCLKIFLTSSKGNINGAVAEGRGGSREDFCFLEGQRNACTLAGNIQLERTDDGGGGREWLKECPRVGEAGWDSGLSGGLEPRQTTHADFWVQHEGGQFAAFAHYVWSSWKHPGSCGSFPAEKASFGNTTNIIFFSVNIAKPKLLPIMGGTLRESYVLEMVSWIWVWNEDIKIKLLSNYIIHTRTTYISF